MTSSICFIWNSDLKIFLKQDLLVVKSTNRVSSHNLITVIFLNVLITGPQWENENNVSVVSDKKVVGAVKLKEETTVDISTGANKGRVAIYKATILKVCGK